MMTEVCSCISVAKFILNVEDYTAFLTTVIVPLFSEYNSKGNLEDSIMHREGQQKENNNASIDSDETDTGEEEIVYPSNKCFGIVTNKGDKNPTIDGTAHKQVVGDLKN